MVSLSVAVLVIAGLSYLSIQLQDSALALAATNGVQAAARADSARLLEPSDPAPHLTQAAIYEGAADAALTSGRDDRAGAVLDDLALAVSSYQKALSVEPADWSLHYEVGISVINLLLAREYLAGSGPDLDYTALIPLAPGLSDWSQLSGAAAAADPGMAQGTLAAPGSRLEAAKVYRNMPQEGLSALALESLNAAKDRNPLASQISEAIGIVNTVSAN